jgi:uncharacterized coiled-coil DUF342 family protein
MEAAQAAADQYLENIAQMKAEAEQLRREAEEMKREAEEKLREACVGAE